MRNWYTAQELAGLPGMPSTDRAIQIRAKRERWEGQARLGSKAVEYTFAVLPKATQQALIEAQVTQQAVATVEPVTQIYSVSLGCDAESASRLNEDQRDVMLARLAFVREIERMSEVVSQQRAVMTLVSLAQTGDLSPYLNERVIRANDRKTANRTLSERTLKRWLSDFRRHGETGLAPARRQQDMRTPVWLAPFLAQYQRPQKPSVTAAYANFCSAYKGVIPSIHAVHRWLKKLSPEALQKGRMSAQELKSLQSFKRRKADMLWPNDVWVADGHTFDAEVINPITGQIFRPEVTTVIDWATRRIVGFSVNLAESTLATLDTLRDGVSRCGMYKIFYVDNGSGFDNAVVYEVNDRLGGTITHSLPYNSQARGVIERSHRTILVRLAKQYDSYIGADMDKEAGTKIHKLSRKQLAQKLKPTVIPEFASFFADLQDALDTYNHQPHRGLPRIRDIDTLRMRHQSPMEAWKSAETEGWEPMRADAAVVESLVRPQVVRKTLKGEVRWNSGIYHLEGLVSLHGEEVRVAYDFRDSSRVWVYTFDGELIGEAKLDGNACAAMPKSLVEQSTEKREKGQLARITKKAKTLTGHDVELRIISPVNAPSADLAPAQLASAQQYAAQLMAEQEQAFEVPGDDMARYRLWTQLEGLQNKGEALTEEQAKWHTSYCKTQGFKSIRDMYDFAAEQARA